MCVRIYYVLSLSQSKHPIHFRRRLLNQPSARTKAGKREKRSEESNFIPRREEEKEGTKKNV